MKKTFLLFLCFAGMLCCKAQDNLIQQFSVYPLLAKDTGTAGFDFLKTVLKDKRIVLLGEQSHEEGATFAAKVRLVRFLHEQMGFGILSMESGLYDNYQAGRTITPANSDNSPLRESIFPIWSEANEFQPMIRYLHEQAAGPHPLLLTGFDCQEGDIFLREYLPALKKEMGKQLVLSEVEEADLDAVITSGPEFLMAGPEDSARFFHTAARILKTLDKATGGKVNLHRSLLRQAFASWLAMLRYEIDDLRERPAVVQNPRDRQMAENLIFLASLYPDQKIICWGASYHFARNITVSHSAVTDAAVKRLDSLLGNEEPTVIDLNGAMPMGQLLSAHFGASLYSMAFSSYEGAFGMAGGKPVSLRAIGSPDSSLESRLARAQASDAFVDFGKGYKNESFFASIMGNVPILAPWAGMFDGLYFIRVSLPASPIATPEQLPVQTRQPVAAIAVPEGMKTIQDAATGSGIGYAGISLLHAGGGVQANAGGYFVLRVPETGTQEQVMLSALGYKTDTLSLADVLARDRFTLQPVQQQLEEVTIGARVLSAKEIVKRAEKKIKDNYSREPGRQEIFFRQTTLAGDTVKFNEEAAVAVTYPDGFYSGGNAGRRLKGNILQFRNTTGNSRNDRWAGVGALWLMYTHNMILEKSNALHRNAFYTYSREGTTELEGREVYKIGFDCKRPMSYTTGFGYPAPLSASGTFYIDAENFALLKVEAFIRRRPAVSGKDSGRITDPWIHYLSETYKRYHGKYFLSAARQLHYSKVVNRKTNKVQQYLTINELLATAIDTVMPVEEGVSLTDIKMREVKEDLSFWRTHNFQVADRDTELYRMFEKR